ncbi:MAG: hypothetical protein Q7U82_17695 [Gammaproteobacteria bacterium]|nr:hypothetical protein [Gammaproteobacteria bacterium]
MNDPIKLQGQLPGRPVVGMLALGFILVLLIVDNADSTPINPFNAPPLIAVGSGQAPSGAHCTQP